MEDEEFVVITTVNTYRKRYAVPKSHSVVDGEFDPQFAIDSVLKGDAKYFALREIGEQMVDAQVVGSNILLQMFDSDIGVELDVADREKVEALLDWKVSNAEVSV